MNNVIVFDEWEIYEDAVDGSGRGKKDWLKNSHTREIGLFKYPKEHIGDPIVLTGEHWSEDIASKLAHLLEIPCAKTQIGIFHGNLGVMSYLVIDQNAEILIEGVQYITKLYPNFDINKLVDNTTQKRYSIQMIEECIKETGLFEEFLKIPIFDALIGNSDRHQSNWGIITDISGNPIRISPLYDNGSSLCCRIKEESIGSYFSDPMRFDALVGSKSFSAISWLNTKTRHFALVQELYTNYYHQTIEPVKHLANTLTDEAISEIINSISTNIMSDAHKRLVNSFLRVRRDKILGIYNIEMRSEL